MNVRKLGSIGRTLRQRCSYESISRIRFGDWDIWETLALLLYFVYVGEAFLKATTFHVSWPWFFHSFLRYSAIGVTFMRTALSRRSYRRVAIQGAFLLFFLYASKYNTYTNLIDLVILILLLDGVAAAGIVQVYFIAVSSMLFLTIGAAKLGIADNLIYYPAHRPRRISFGSIYPTDFAAYFFFLSLAWLYIRREKVRFIELGGMAAMITALHYYCDARLSCLCLGAAVLVSLLLKLFRKDGAFKDNAAGRLMGKATSLARYAVPLIAVFMVVMAYFYRDGNTFFRILDKALNQRLAYGHKAIVRYGFHPLGKPIPMNGFGGSTIREVVSEYFFVDSSYLYILLRYGIMVFLLVMGGFYKMARKAFRKGDAWLVWILALLAVYAIMEHHVMELNYCPFFLLFFAKGLTAGPGGAEAGAAAMPGAEDAAAEAPGNKDITAAMTGNEDITAAMPGNKDITAAMTGNEDITAERSGGKGGLRA